MDPSRSVHTELINGNVSNEVGGIIQRGEREGDGRKEGRQRLAISAECAFVSIPPMGIHSKQKQNHAVAVASSADSGGPVVVKLEALLACFLSLRVLTPPLFKHSRNKIRRRLSIHPSLCFSFPSWKIRRRN